MGRQGKLLQLIKANWQGGRHRTGHVTEHVTNKCLAPHQLATIRHHNLSEPSAKTSKYFNLRQSGIWW